MGASPTLGFGQFFGDSEVRRELSGFSLARIAASKPPLEVPDHTHETAHLVLVLDGPYVTGAERPEPGRAPVLVYNPPHTTHRDRFGDNEGVFFTLSISDRRLDEVGSARLPARPIAFASGPAVRIARRLVRAFATWPPRSTSRAEALCLGLLVELLDDAPGSRPRPPEWLRAAREDLATRVDEPLRLGALAARAGVHPVHLARAFQRFYGRTPGAFLRERRLAAATLLLRDTGLPIVEIALRTGFADQSHFTRRFTQVHGVAPAAWRRKGPARKAG